MKYRMPAFFSALVLAACAAPRAVPTSPVVVSPAVERASGTVLDIPPRLQWNANFGYCGETSLISAGLYYGQYISQYTARAVAGDGTPQYEHDSQLLLGVNDGRAAIRMHLAAIRWDTASEPNADAFLRWVLRNVERGYPVAIGVYTNERLFGNKGAGDPSYDHIVPVTGVTASSLTFSDNGLWNPTGKPPFTFTYPLATFPKTRAQANDPHGTIYALANDGRNYGIAIRGVVDGDGETLPVRLATSVKWERPAMRKHSNVRPRAMPLTLTIVVSDLKPGVAYRLYRYDRLARIPDAHFNANASHAKERWPIRIASGTTFTMTEAIESDEVAAYRAVPASAP